MKNSDLFDIYTVLEEVGKEKCGVKLAYAIGKNKSKLQSEIKIIQEASKKIEKNKEIQKELDKIQEEIKKKYTDEDGKLNTILANQEFFEIQKQDKYKPLLEELQEINKENNKLLQEKSELELHKIKLDDIGDDIITGNQMQILDPIIEE